MKRLTFKDAIGKYVITCNKFDNWFELKLPVHLSGEAINRLAELEDKNTIYKLTNYDKETDTGVCICGRITEACDGEFYCRHCGQKLSK